MTIQGVNLSEHQEQAAFIERCQFWVNQGEHPELALIFAIPNERMSKAERLKMAAEGAKPGVPDLCLPVARGGHHGLYMETKVNGSKPRPEQREWLKALGEQGYYCKVCQGYDELIATVELYLSWPQTVVADPLGGDQ